MLERNNNQKRNSVLYDEDDKKLVLFIIIVNNGLASIYKNNFINENLCHYVLTLSAKGTATKEMYQMLGLSQVKKDIVIAIAPKRNLNDLFYYAREQFIVSKRTKGVAFSVDLSSIINLKAYKYFMYGLGEEKDNGK